MAKKKELKRCPNCDEKWSKAEIESQECENCGFPKVKGVSIIDEDEEDEGFDFEDDF